MLVESEKEIQYKKEISQEVLFFFFLKKNVFKYIVFPIQGDWIPVFWVLKRATSNLTGLIPLDTPSLSEYNSVLAPVLSLTLRSQTPSH